MKRSAVALLAALLALPLAGGEAHRFSRSVPFSPSKDHRLGVRIGEVTIESVTINRWPDPDDLRKGEHDLNDKHTCRLEFRYTNRDLDKDWKVHYSVTVTGGGRTFAHQESTETLDKGKVDDTHSFSLRMRTHEYKLARAMKIDMEVWRKD